MALPYGFFYWTVWRDAVLVDHLGRPKHLLFGPRLLSRMERRWYGRHDARGACDMTGVILEARLVCRVRWTRRDG